MSSWETRRTQSAIFFNTKTKDGEEGNSRIRSKRKRNELTPTILVEQTSTSTLVGEEDNEPTHCSQKLRSSDKNKEQIALKLNRLKNKAVRYKSHKDFLSRCIAEELIPKGLNLNWNPQLAITTKDFLSRGSQS